MKKCILVTGAVLLFASIAAATDVPSMETFLGYNFVRFNPDSGFVPSFNANGGSGQFAYNFNKWISGVIDAGAVTKGTLNGFNVDTTVVDFVAGPRITWHNHSRFVPFVQALFGGAYGTSSISILSLPLTTNGILPPGIVVNPNLPISTRLVASHTGFAMLAGGGLDIKLSKHIAFRPIGADYYLTRVPAVQGGNSNKNNFRYSGGINFLFGAK